MAINGYDKKVNKHQDWGGDNSTGGLPVLGSRVQEFIKEQLENRIGVLYYDSANNRYIAFADEENRDAYIETSDPSLVLGTFDAPFNYEASIELLTPTYVPILLGKTDNIISFRFDVLNKSGVSVGEAVQCTYTFSNGSTKKTLRARYQYGQTVTLNIDKYLGEGTNNIVIAIVGENTLAATSAAITYQVVNLSLSSSYNISKVYNLMSNPTAVAEVPWSISGYGTKIVEWFLDGVQLPQEANDEVTTTSVSRTKYISMAGLAQGKHSLQVRAYTNMNGEYFYSDTLYMDLMVYNGANRNNIISVSAVIPSGEPLVTDTLTLMGITQYVPYDFRFAVYSPSNEAEINVDVLIDSVKQSTVTTSNDTVNTYSLVVNTSGNHTLVLQTTSASYELGLAVEVSDSAIEEITDGLELSLRAIGKSNSDADRDSWSSGAYNAIFTGFEWTELSGWSNNALVINSGASVEIGFAPLASDATATGKTIEFEFATANVTDDSAVICDLTQNGTGLMITASEAILTSSGGAKVSTKFKSEENIRIAFVINPDSGVDNKGLAFIYINGIVSGGINFTTAENYLSDKTIEFVGSEDAEVRLKAIRIYRNALTHDQVLNNYTIYRDNSEEMNAVYSRNDIYTEGTTKFNAELLANYLPVMIVTGDIPTLEGTTDKNEQITVDVRYINNQDPERSFTMTGAAMRPQGTSSMGYPKKNFRLYTQKLDGTKLFDYEGNEVANKLYSFKEGAIPVNCWCMKADYAESSGTHNTGIARLWNDILRDVTLNGQYVCRTNAQQAALDSGYEYDVRTTIDGFPILMFYRLTENDDLVFIGKYNFNNDKSTENVFGFTNIPGFDNTRMQCWEILNNGNHLALFEDTTNFDTEWKDAFEGRYPDGSTMTSDLKAFCEWVVSTKGNVAKFSAEKWSHIEVYRMAAYYIYLMRFGAVDQLVKNAMLTSEDGEKFYFILYDNDTINGLRNDGRLIFAPNINRQSLDPTYIEETYVYAGHTSTLWNNLEADEEFMNIVKQLDAALYQAGLTYNNVIKMFDEEQAGKWAERVYNQDAQYKYIGPYAEGGANNLFMMQGSRLSHRRWWLSKRFELYDALYVSGAYKATILDFKVANGTPIGQQFSIAAAADGYYGYGVNDVAVETGVELEKGESHTFTTQQVLNIGDPVRIYAANNLEEVNLSALLPYLSQVSLAEIDSAVLGNRLKRLTLGKDSGTNNSLNDISGLATATKLEEIDIRGYMGLGSLDFSALKYLKSLKAERSGLTTCVLPQGSPIELLSLPDTLVGFELYGCAKLNWTNFTIEDWANVQAITIQNCPELTGNFAKIYDWYTSKSAADSQCSLNMTGVSWAGVSADALIAIGGIGMLSLKGTVVIDEVTEAQMQQLRDIYGENCFSKTADFYINAPAGASFILGADEVMEGSSYQYSVVSANEGIATWSITSGSSYATINSNGVLTVTSRGDNTVRNVTIQAKYSPTAGGVVETLTKTIVTNPLIYVTGGTIGGNNYISGEGEYTLTVTPANITTDYTVAWTVNNNAVTVVSQSKTVCRLAVEGSGLTGNFTLTATITRSDGKTRTATKTISLGVLVTVNILSNQASDSTIANVQATIAYGNVKVGNGQSVALPPNTVTSITFPSVDGYATPKQIDFNTGTTNATYTGTYKTTLLTVEMSSNQGADSAISGATASVSASGMSTKTLETGSTTKIPYGVSCTITWSDIAGYLTPTNQTFTPTSTSATKSGQYQTEVVTVTELSAYDGKNVIGQTITINGVSHTWQGTSIVQKVPFGATYSVAASAIGDDYDTPSESFTASQVSRQVALQYTQKVGSWITLNQTISDPATMLSGDINGTHIQAIRANSHRYLGKLMSGPAMMVCRLDDNDSNYYHDGTAANLTGSEGDVFMKLPRFWYQAKEKATNIWEIGFYYGDNTPDGNWKLWDGRDLIGVYEAYVSSSKVYSRSGVSSSGNVSQSNFKAYASARGAGFSIVKWKHHNIMAFLYYAMYGHMNSQAQIGAGTDSYSKQTGQTDALGMEDTVASVNGNSQSINFWGLENWWGNKSEWVDNVVVNPESANGLWRITEDDGTTRDVQGKIFNDYMKTAIIGEHLDLIPSSSSYGSETTGYCDYVYTGGNSTSRVIYRSGNSMGNGGGVCNAVTNSRTYIHSVNGSRLAFRGDIVEAESVEVFQSLQAIG